MDELSSKFINCGFLHQIGIVMNKLLIILFILVPLAASAQDSFDSLSHHQAGFSASTLSGYGLTYSYIFSRDFRIKSTLFAYYNDRGVDGHDWAGSVGLELQYSLQMGTMTRFYGLIGGNYYHYFDTYPGYYAYTDSSGRDFYNPSNSEENDFAVGIGAGFEVLFWRHLAIDIHAAFQFTQTKYNYSPSSISVMRYIGPGGGGEISYRF